MGSVSRFIQRRSTLTALRTLRIGRDPVAKHVVFLDG
jgi:hypothetical protein